MNFKRLLLTFTILVFSFKSYCQRQNILNVELKPQLRSNWCWAASIEMIMNYHNQDRTQCEIVSAFRQLRPDPDDDCGSCSTADCDFGSIACECDISSTASCNNRLHFETQQHGICNNFTKIFNNFNFSSTEKISDPSASSLLTSNYLTWTDVTYQIDNNMPFLLYVSRTDERPGIGIDGDHIIVVNGYIENVNGSNFLVIKDPWSPCSGGGCTYALSWDTVIQPTTGKGNIEGAWVWVYNIAPNPIVHNKPIIKSICSNKPDIITLNQDAMKVTYSFMDLFDKCLSKDLCLDCMGKNIAKESPIWNGYKEISYNKMLDKSKYQSPYFPAKKIIVRFPSVKDLQFVLRKDKYGIKKEIIIPRKIDTTDYWAIESIQNCSFLSALCPNSQGNVCQTIDVLLNNGTKTIGTKDTPYRIVTYPIFNYKFGCFTDNRVNYCMTDKFIPDLSIQGLFLKPFVAIKQSILFDALHTKTVAYDAAIKLKYPNGGAYSR